MTVLSTFSAPIAFYTVSPQIKANLKLGRTRNEDGFCLGNTRFFRDKELCLGHSEFLLRLDGKWELQMRWLGEKGCYRGYQKMRCNERLERASAMGVAITVAS